MSSHTPKRTISQREIEQTVEAVKKYRTKKEAATSLGITRSMLYERLQAGGISEQEADSPFAIEHAPPIGNLGGPAWEIKSLPDNTFRLAAFGDLHAASKYCRWDVRADLTKKAEEFGAQIILDTGNWIDGEKYNRYEVETIGLENQCKLLAKRYPRSTIPTYAVTGDDHEGWYTQSVGVNVGRTCEAIMREAGHDWTDLGYMEADIVLRNANSDASSILRVIHTGGGSAYALSYRVQKIVESLEGGEKPAALFVGHLHKMWCGNIRNVWCVLTACAQDQSTFMRKRSNEAHVGGVLVEFHQDPKTGALTRMKSDQLRYFSRSYYVKSGKANNRWSGHGQIIQIPRGVNVSD